MNNERSSNASRLANAGAGASKAALSRRRLVIGGSAAAGALAAAGASAAAKKPRRMKPQPGDVLVHAFGANAAQPIATKEVGDEPLSAFSMDPAIRLVRDGSLHNQLAVVRVDADAISPKAQNYAVADANGSFLVYSAACTHTGCEVNGWRGETRRLVCPCHGSEFDVQDAARVVNGPAPKPLAMLQVALAEGSFRVAGRFSRRVGPAPI